MDDFIVSQKELNFSKHLNVDHNRFFLKVEIALFWSELKFIDWLASAELFVWL